MEAIAKNQVQHNKLGSDRKKAFFEVPEMNSVIANNQLEICTDQYKLLEYWNDWYDAMGKRNWRLKTERQKNAVFPEIVCQTTPTA